MRQTLKTTPLVTWLCVALVLLIVVDSLYLSFSVNRSLDEVSDGAGTIRRLMTVDEAVRRIDSDLLDRTGTIKRQDSDAAWEQWTSSMERARAALDNGGSMAEVISPFAGRLDGELHQMQRLRAELASAEASSPQSAAAESSIRQADLRAQDSLQSAIRAVRGRLSAISVELVAQWKNLIAMVLAMCVLSLCLGILLIRRQRDARRLKLANELLRDSEERFRLTFEENPLGMALVAPDFRLLKVNKTLTRMLGFSEAELLARTFADITHAEDVDRDVEQTVKLFRGELRSYETEKRYIAKDGGTVWAHLTATAIRISGGDAIYGLGMVEDITERKRSEHRYRELFEHSLAGIFRSTVDGRILDCNPAFARMFGYGSVQEMTALPAADLYLEPGDRQKFLTALRRRGAVTDYEIRVRRKNGSALSCLENVSLSRDRDGTEVMEGTIVDITDRKRAEDELRHRADLERLLLKELDHRVRNNLVSLITLIDMARSRAGSVESFAGTIRSRVEGMAAVHSLLSRSRWAPLKLSALVGAVAPGRRGGQLVLDGRDVLIPPRQVTALGMVIHELMVNSVKHGALKHDAGQVHLSWKRDDPDADPNRLRLSWRETGGPLIEVKPVPGSGTELIAGLVRAELQGEPAMSFPREGANHEFVIRIDPGLAVEE